MTRLFNFNRVYPFHREPTFIYNVWAEGKLIGSVWRKPEQEGVWFANPSKFYRTKPLKNSFRTRWEATDALWNLHTGNASERTYGGY